MKVIAESVVQENLWQVMICYCTPWEVECGWVRAEPVAQGGCAVRLTQQSPGATCARSPGMWAGEHSYILLSCVQKPVCLVDIILQPATTHRSFLVRS